MASTSRRLAFSARGCSSRIQAKRTAPRFLPSWQRPLSTTSSRCIEYYKPDKERKASRQLESFLEDLEEVQELSTHVRPFREARNLNNYADPTKARSSYKDGFWAEGEKELGPDEDYYADDITSNGHRLLEEHRELREYARLIAWELPLLNQLARPYEPPTSATPFRFRYTSYLGERHPAANKVVVEFCAKDMKLSPVQTDKLIKLAGVRYNPSTDTIKMSCEQFDTQAQNKRYLGETISKLLEEAKNGKDTFADVPFDFRHHKPKVVHKFPKEWILTPERKQYLEEQRAQNLLKEDEKKFTGKLIDGDKVVQTNLPKNLPQMEAVTVGARKGKGRR